MTNQWFSRCRGSVFGIKIDGFSRPFSWSIRTWGGLWGVLGRLWRVLGRLVALLGRLGASKRRRATPFCRRSGRDQDDRENSLSVRSCAPHFINLIWHGTGSAVLFRRPRLEGSRKDLGTQNLPKASKFSRKIFKKSIYQISRGPKGNTRTSKHEQCYFAKCFSILF